MKQYKIQIDNKEIIIEQDDDGKFIIPSEFRLQGRFPANVILECTCDEVIEGREITSRAVRHNSGGKTFGGDKARPPIEYLGYTDKSTIHTNPECPCYMLDKQSGINASRFFYVAKAGRKERNIGSVNNNHPTVKPLKLMEYLCILTQTPTGGIVLDPFAGS